MEELKMFLLLANPKMGEMGKAKRGQQTHARASLAPSWPRSEVRSTNS